MFTVTVSLILSCNNAKQSDMNIQISDFFLSEMALIYWDFNYTFPTTYIESRDTGAWFFSKYTTTDSFLLCHASEITYTNQDSVLVITYRDDTLALVSLPCSCDWNDEIPYGPRAYDSLNNMILDDFINVSWHGEQMHLTYDLVHELFPAIENKMNDLGYIQVCDKKKYPQYLLIEYHQTSNTIDLIKACAKYKSYFYDEYVRILKDIFSEYCKKNHVSRLLTAVDVYIIDSNGMK